MFEDKFITYFKNVKKKIVESTEYTLRTDFEILLNNIKNDEYIKIIQEAKKEDVSEKPDYKIKKNGLIIGYIETKNIDVDLNKIIDPHSNSRDSIQFRKYIKITDNLILCNYREFMLFKLGNREPVCNELLFSIADVTIDINNITPIYDLFELFFMVEPKSIDDPERLSILLADRAKLFKEHLQVEISTNGENSYIKRLIGENGLYDLLKNTLIEDLTIDEFTDAYIQTIIYGLFIAGLQSNISEGLLLTNNNIIDFIPKSVGLIQELFETIKISSIPESISWIIEESINIINNCDIKTLISKFSYRQHEYQDPFVYFYETFLSKYDKEKKKEMGVFYTPIPIVRFIVNNINLLIIKYFNVSGLKDTKVNLLDFAAGTGTFLLESYKNALNNIDLGLRKTLIKDHLLKHFYGFEYLIAPYAISHLKLINYLNEYDYYLSEDERIGVYLADTLDDKRHETWTLFPKISEESERSLKIKIEDKILIVLGNPPYNVKSKNKKPFTDKLLLPYKKGLDEQKVNWDDYEKFIAYAHWKIKENDKGVIGIITNNSYIDAVTKKIMRKKLFEDFDTIYILNLHGNSNRGEPDENVFDIRIGVGIWFFVKLSNKNNVEKKLYYYSSLDNGIIKKTDKFDFLDNNTIDEINWIELNPSEPNYWYIYRDVTDEEEYQKGWSINDIFIINGSGIKTDRDDLFIDHNKEELERRMNILFTKRYDDRFINKYRVENSSSYPILDRIKDEQYDEKYVYKYHYRPFVNKWIYYKRGVTSRPAYKVMKYLMGRDNIALITVRQFAEDVIFNHAFVSSELIDIRITTSNRGTCYVYPLYLNSADGENASQTTLTGLTRTDPYSDLKKKPNFSDAFKSYISEKYPEIPSPENIFNYIYATLYCLNYRIKYNEFLKKEYPKIPFVNDINTFNNISDLGGQLIANHLLDVQYVGSQIGYFPVSGNNLVIRSKIKYVEVDNKLYISDTQCFENISNDVWNFSIGGYRVIKKWLKEHDNIKLTYSEIENFKKILNSIQTTINIMEDINEILDL